MKGKKVVAIFGFGNVGKALDKELVKFEDFETRYIFTRRDSKVIKPLSNAKVIQYKIEDEKLIILNEDINEEIFNEIDFSFVALGSSSDVLISMPVIAKYTSTVDCYDNHSKIPEYVELIDEIAFNHDHTSIVATGWDPGIFSLVRLYEEAFLPNGKSFTFWGPGVSQGHSNALRKIEGVKYAIQYTMPKQEKIKSALCGYGNDESTKDRHFRVCYIVPEEGYDTKKIEKAVLADKDYFAGYEVKFYYYTEEEFFELAKDMPHGGHVIRTGMTGEDDKNLEVIDFSLKLDSNPEFTANVMIASGRALLKISKYERGAFTLLDIPPSFFTDLPRSEMIKEFI